jgi:hypothetical protein
VLLQICRLKKNGKYFIRKAAQQAVSVERKTPRQLWALSAATEAATNTFGTTSQDGVPPQNPVIAEAMRTSVETNPYERSLRENIKKQERYAAMIPDEVLDQLDTVGELPSVAEKRLQQSRIGAMENTLAVLSKRKRLQPKTEMLITRLSRFQY